MAIDVSWDEQHEGVIHVVYPPRWTWNELYTAEKHGVEMINAMGCPHVVSIHDFTKSDSLPPLAVTHIQNLVKALHPNTRLTVFVGMNRFVRLMWDTASRLLPVKALKGRFTFADSIEQAREMAITLLAELNTANP